MFEQFKAFQATSITKLLASQSHPGWHCVSYVPLSERFSLRTEGQDTCLNSKIPA